MQQHLAAVCEKLMEAASRAKAYEDVLQAKTRAAMRRAGEPAVEKLLEESKGMSAAQLKQALEQRQQDLAKINAYAQGSQELEGVITFPAA